MRAVPESVTDPDNEEDSPRIRITDKRRFSNLGTEVAPAAEAGATGSDEADLEGEPAQDQLAAAKDEAARYLDHLQRLQAEFDNYRKRVLKEQAHAVDQAAQPTMRRLLEVLDDFELALIHATEKPDFDRFLHGVELVYAKLMDALKAEGMQRIEAEGKPFDPQLHEALMQTGEGDELFVADVLRPGYTLKGRVIRPAGVRVERR